jgi:hypothetical protein
VSLESVAREPAYRGYEEGDAVDGVLIDFKLGVARQALRDAMSSLEGLLTRLNARPGKGINFAMIYEIGRAERRIADARWNLRRLEERTGQ